MKINEKFRANSNYNSHLNLSNAPFPFFSQREKVLNLVDFINPKHKFEIQDFFDQKASKIFLESKDIAMKKIYLDDEIICPKNTDNKSDEIKDKKPETKTKNNSKKAFSCHKIIHIKAKKIKKIKKVKTEKKIKDLVLNNNDYKNKTKNINKFYFSKINKKLMSNDDDINVSSISKGDDK